MSYKAMADCLFDISTQVPDSQEIIQHYLPRASIVDNQTSLRELSSNYQHSVNVLTETSKTLKENLKQMDIYEDLSLFEGYLQGTQEFDDIQENVRSDYLRGLLGKLQKVVG